MRISPTTIMSTGRTVCIALAVFFCLTASGHAGLDDVLQSRGWQEITFDKDKKTPNTFTARDGGEGMGIDVLSESSVSVAYINVDVDIGALPVLEWEWRSRDPDPDTDVTRKGGDDRTLTVYIAFPWQPEHASLMEKLQRPFVEALRGKDTPGRILTYIWGGGAPMGTEFEHVYAGRYGSMKILRTPDTARDTWHAERVNVPEDFMRNFGFPPANPVYVAVSSDSDDTNSRIRASVRGLRFTAN